MASKKKELLSSFFEHDKLHFNRCLAPGMSCGATAIRSHSLQNSRVLDLLVREGHVKGLTKRVDKVAGPVIFFDDIGRNQATTFTGFCSEHDSNIFKPLETNSFRPNDDEHLFLVAYRAVVKELHTLMEATYKIQTGYQERVRLGVDSGDEPTPAGMFAVEYMMKSYLTHEYKCHFDEALVSKQYGGVLHDLVTISHEEATIAVCSLFSLDGLPRNDDWVRVALNVLPISGNESMVVFSYLPADTTLVRSALSPVLATNGHHQKYLLSKLILNNCSNFVLSPAYYDRWSPEKKKAVTDYFLQTLFTGNLEIESEHLYLF
jgi:hypothetical protein